MLEANLISQHKKNWWVLNGKWSSIENFNGPSGTSMAVLHNNELYFMGGYNGTFIKKIYKYNPTDNVFTIDSEDATIPGMIGGTAHSYGGLIYLLGSYAGPVASYDLSTKKVTSVAATGLGSVSGENYFTSQLVGNTIYFFGGYSGGASVRAFNIDTGLTTVVSTDFPIHAAYCRSVSIGTDIYVIGGCKGDTINAEMRLPSYKATKFDTVNNTWTALAELPEPVLGGAICKINDETIAYFGGFLLNPGISGSVAGNTKVKIYHIPTNTWSINLVDAPVALTNSSFIDTPTELFAIGGYSISNRVYKYTK